MKLQSMTDFVLEQYKNNYHANTPTRILNYANFLKQPLELWMFIPCDEKGNVLEKIDCDLDIKANKLLEYQQAKERCLFDGFEFQGANKEYAMPFVFLGEDVTLYPETFDETSTIEDLVYYSEFITLTQRAAK